MPLPQGFGFNPPGGGNVDFGTTEGISALQRNPQIRRAFGAGTVSVTGSVLYGIWGTTGASVSCTDMSGNAFINVFPLPIVFDQGIPTVNPITGGALTVSASTATNLLVLYK